MDLPGSLPRVACEGTRMSTGDFSVPTRPPGWLGPSPIRGLWSQEMLPNAAALSPMATPQECCIRFSLYKALRCFYTRFFHGSPSRQKISVYFLACDHILGLNPSPTNRLYFPSTLAQIIDSGNLVERHMGQAIFCT